jgi:hypothetical protein
LGPKQALQSLCLSSVILLLSNGIYQFPPAIGIFRWLILFVAALRVLPFCSLRALQYQVSLGIFFLAAIVVSWMESPYLIVSLAKLTVFTLWAATVLAAFASLSSTELDYMRKWILSLTVAVILVSLPTFFVPSIGFMRNGSGFQGILKHPQTFALFLVPPAAYLGAEIVMSKNKKGIWTVLLGIIIFALLFMARARTAMIAVILGILSAGITPAVLGRVASFDWSPGKGLLKAASLGASFGLLIMVSPQFSTGIEDFVFKTSDAKSVEDAFSQSRGRGITFFWERFIEKPFTGHGFGIDVLHGNGKKTETFMGIPISAATEKGFLPTAFLEEVGIVGLAAFLPFFLLLMRGAVKTGKVAFLAMFVSCLAVNIGEAVFFSPGYIGGYLWILIGLCTAKG